MDFRSSRTRALSCASVGRAFATTAVTITLKASLSPARRRMVGSFAGPDRTACQPLGQSSRSVPPSTRSFAVSARAGQLEADSANVTTVIQVRHIALGLLVRRTDSEGLLNGTGSSDPSLMCRAVSAVNDI